MSFDTDDLSRMEQDGSLIDVIIHEMGHVLGIGTLWELTGNTVDCLTQAVGEAAGGSVNLSTQAAAESLLGGLGRALHAAALDVARARSRRLDGPHAAAVRGRTHGVRGAR